MELKRRGFLGGMLAAFATTPEKVLKASGVDESAIGHAIGGQYVEPLTESFFGVSSDGAQGYAAERVKLLALKALRPKWFEDKRREHARDIEVLDVDLASFRSVSPAAKICIQRQRNYDRSIEHDLNRLDQHIGEAMFKP